MASLAASTTMARENNCSLRPSRAATLAWLNRESPPMPPSENGKRGTVPLSAA